MDELEPKLGTQLQRHLECLPPVPTQRLLEVTEQKPEELPKLDEEKPLKREPKVTQALADPTHPVPDSMPQVTVQVHKPPAE